MPIRKIYIPPGPTVVWKKNPNTQKIEPKVVQRNGYTKTIKTKY